MNAYERVCVSACLLGRCCKYNGGSNLNERVLRFCRGRTVIPVCPEVLGGLPTPRVPSEICGGRVVNREGADVDAAFRLGAERALELALSQGAQLAILQPRSPSCGIGRIYDGSFSGTLTQGNGVFAALVRERGIPAVHPDALDALEAAPSCVFPFCRQNE